MMTANTAIRSIWLALPMLLSACTSNIPQEIRLAPEPGPEINQVRKQPDAFISQNVRWGGIILQTENLRNSSKLIIIGLPLNDEGKPQAGDNSPGRFIAMIDEFVEPTLFSQERHITVTGKISETETLNIGDYPYEYPVIQVEHYYLWPAEPDPADINYPPYWWYDPWYSPYYPWHYPYYPYYY